jgi:hypothetical protein
LKIIIENRKLFERLCLAKLAAGLEAWRLEKIEKMEKMEKIEKIEKMKKREFGQIYKKNFSKLINFKT